MPAVPPPPGPAPRIATGDNLDEWLDTYEPHETEATICAANALIAEHTRADEALAEAQGPEAIRVAAERVADIERRIDAASRTFRFRSVTTKEWADLLAANPPTDDQLRSDPGLEFNPDGFPAAAVAASSVDGLTVEQVTKMRGTVQHSEWAKVWDAVLIANLGVLPNPKSLLAGVVLRQNGGSGTTPASEASHAASS